MNSVLNKAGMRLFEKNLEKYAPADPLYEVYTDKKGKQKRRKRDLPPGLSKRDARILRSVKKRAHYLDKGVSLCGMRVGWTFFIGLIPFAGDIADILLNYCLVVRPARKADIPQWLLRRMLMNNAVSAGVGFIPIAGDVVLAMFKANSRNAALLEEFLRIRGEEFIKLSGGVEHPEDKKTGKGISSWFSGGKKKKKTTTGTSPTDGIPTSDIEQVKPGAGMSGEEVRNMLPLQVTAPLPMPGTKSVSSRGGSPKTQTPPSSAWSSFSFKFGRKKCAGADVEIPPALPNQGRGRFVENMESAPPGSSADK